MFTLISSDIGADHYACKSTDDKPTDGGIRDGSDVIEKDTGKAFMYDSEDKKWYEL